MQQVNIQLKPSLDEWLKLSELLAAFCKEHDLGEPLSMDLQLVCEEWFINIVIHGYQEGGITLEDAEPITIGLWLDGKGEIHVQFVDGAPAFDPLAHESPDVSLPAEERPIGGLGIHLIKVKMDNCSYDWEEGRNRFTMRKMRS